jgi:hypothetical protein
VSRKADGMNVQRCTCGFTEADGDDETTEDHLLRMFTAEDDRGADGLVHLEGNPKLTCLCGVSASTAAELDSHFLEVFVPVGRTDFGGIEHEMTV